MNLNIFFNNYKNYISYPIFFLISLFFQLENQINKENLKKNGFSKINENEFNFIMLDENTNIDTIQDNPNIFITKYEETNNNNQYLCVLTLREQILFSKYFYEIIHSYSKKELSEKYPQSYTTYKVNKITCDIIIYASLTNSQQKIKDFLYSNLTHVKKILEYKKKYNLENIDVEKLYNQWKQPIEPNQDKNKYEELINNYISKEDIILNDIKYTDIKCLRNPMQKDYLIYLNELYDNNETYKNLELKNIPLLYTIYRTENNTGIIYTILF